MQNLASRRESVLLCGMIGDALGAPVEGWPARMIAKVYGKVDRYYSGKPLGISEERCGMYTDDTNCALSIASSIVRMGGKIDMRDCAKSHVEFARHEPKRGCPQSAEAVIEALESGADPASTGRMIFPDGSYANGGAMKIGAVGVLLHNADNAELLENVKEAIMCTHVHEEAIDGAFIIAKSIAYLLHVPNVDEFEPQDFLDTLQSACKTKEMRKRISLLQKHCNKSSFDSIFCGLGELKTTPGMEIYGEMDFQIRSVVAVGCALWSFVSSWREPLNCFINAIGLGGDTDTIATMVGYLVGALHGKDWIPSHLLDCLENGEYGRDYCLQLSHQLAQFNTI